MKKGDKIGYNRNVFIVEEFRHTLGIFFTSVDKMSGKNFIPLCEMYRIGPDSVHSVTPCGREYYTNMIPGWEMV